MKILSIVVPSYNVEKYLDKCLTPFSDDRLQEFLEVIIVNDGSKDKTQEIAERYIQKYPGIFKLINKQNGGHGSAVNAGIRNATGKYFRIVDGDDWVNTENLVTLIDKMKNIDSDLVIDEKTTVNFTTGDVVFFPYKIPLEYEKEYSFLDVCSKEYGDYYMLHTMSVKLELLKNHNIQLCEHVFYVDYEFIVKVTAYARSVTFIDLDIYRYLIGNISQSVDNQNYVRRYHDHLTVLKEILFFQENKQFERCRRKYINLKIKLMIHTNLNICLIYNKNRAVGLEQAKALKKFLVENYGGFYYAVRKRYWVVMLLHYFGVDFEKLQRILRRH